MADYMYPGTGGAEGAPNGTPPRLCSQEAWESASQRLIRSGEWRVPTQAELDAASQGLIGQRICIRGYGVGTVRQFIKSNGWGRHSAHAVDMGVVAGVISIKLLRKRNGETPWLKSTGRGSQSRGVGENVTAGSQAANADAQVRMAQLFMQRGNDNAALEVVLKGLQIHPTEPHLLRLKATLQPTPTPSPTSTRSPYPSSVNQYAPSTATAAHQERPPAQLGSTLAPSYEAPQAPAGTQRSPLSSSSSPPPYHQGASPRPPPPPYSNTTTLMVEGPTSIAATRAAQPAAPPRQPRQPPLYHQTPSGALDPAPVPAPGRASLTVDIPAYGMQTGAPPLPTAARRATETVIEMGFSRKLVERVQTERYDCCEMFYSDPMALASSVLARGEQHDEEPPPPTSDLPVLATATQDFAGTHDGQVVLSVGNIVKIIAKPRGLEKPWFPDSPVATEWWKVQHTEHNWVGYCPADALAELPPELQHEATHNLSDLSPSALQPVASPTMDGLGDLIDLSEPGPVAAASKVAPAASTVVPWLTNTPTDTSPLEQRYHLPISEPEPEPAAPQSDTVDAHDNQLGPPPKSPAPLPQPTDLITRQNTGSLGLGNDDWISRRRAKTATSQYNEDEEDTDWIAARIARTSMEPENDDGGEDLLNRTSSAEMRSIFDVMDVDKSGNITIQNIKDLMFSAGEELSEDVLAEMFRYADVTADGMVSYEEFERVVHLYEAEQHTMRELFDALDVSGTGVLSADDLTTFLQMNGEAPEVVPTMMAAADTESGEISFEQFVPLLRDQLGAAAPTTGWGHQSEEDVIAQLLENDATMANPTLRAHLEARFEASRAAQGRVTARSKADVVLRTKGEVGAQLGKVLAERSTLREAARTVEAKATAAELGAVHIPRTQSTVQREATAEDDSNATRYAELGEDGLRDELTSVENQVKELRRQLGL